jgi:hypothetical protein
MDIRPPYVVAFLRDDALSVGTDEIPTNVFRCSVGIEGETECGAAR